MTQSARLRTKMFQESLVAARVPGGTPGAWLVRQRTQPVDEAINHWLQETGHRLVSCSPPGIHVQWLDTEMTTRSVIVAVMVTYEEAEYERTITVPAPADPAAGGPDGPPGHPAPPPAPAARPTAGPGPGADGRVTPVVFPPPGRR